MLTPQIREEENGAQTPAPEKGIKKLLSPVRRAVEDYAMIEDGDRIAVGISGGKDSLALLLALTAMRSFYPKRYEVVGVTVDMGFSGTDFSAIRRFCEECGAKYRVVPTEIAKIIFDVRKESNPCSLCAKMRRGALHAEAQRLGCNKVALGHHCDDVVDTFMLNLFYEGRLGCFSPVTYLSERKLTLIRPLLYCEEREIVYFANKLRLPVMKSPCPEDHNTERENMKNLLRQLERGNRGLRKRIFHAICKGEIDGFRTVDRFAYLKKKPDA